MRRFASWIGEVVPVEILLVAGIVVFWLAMQLWILPGLGVST